MFQSNKINIPFSILMGKTKRKLNWQKSQRTNRTRGISSHNQLFRSFTMKGVIQMGNICQACWSQVGFFVCLLLLLFLFFRWAKLRHVSTQLAKIHLNRNMLNPLRVQGSTDSQGSGQKPGKINYLWVSLS